MKNGNKYKWSPPEWLSNPVKETVLFHDTKVDVYSGVIEVGKIILWKKNNRTTLDLEHLSQELGKKDISKLSDKEIIDYILKQGLHKIQELAGSIKKNDVRVPLTLTYKKELLDGNRRFLACKYLIQKKVIDNSFEVPAYCLNPDIDDELRLKIIAEMNFLPDYKEAWPREVRAKFAVGQFNIFSAQYNDEDKAYEQVDYLLRISRQELNRFKGVLIMIDEYINYVKKDTVHNQQAAERFTRTKFHFFEEFYNKACIGKTPIKDQKTLKISKQLLYKYLLNTQIKSTTKVRQLTEMVRYEPSRSHLEKKDGSFELAHGMFQDYSRPRKAGMKLLHFCEWLEGLSEDDKSELSKDLKKRLLMAAKRLNNN